MTISNTTLIADIARHVPSSVHVFERYGIDFCCGGERSLGAACDALGLSAADIGREIDNSTATHAADTREWTAASLHELTQHIVTTYHEPLREQLPRLELLAGRVARIHGPKAPRLLSRIDAAIRELSWDLTAHMRKEEHVLFPGICGLECSGASAIPLAEAIRVMELEHDRAGALLADLRAATDGFTPPEWACATTRALYQGLASLESELHVHVHLENNVLFPQALRLAEAMAGSWT